MPPQEFSENVRDLSCPSTEDVVQESSVTTTPYCRHLLYHRQPALQLYRLQHRQVVLLTFRRVHKAGFTITVRVIASGLQRQTGATPRLCARNIVPSLPILIPHQIFKVSFWT
ncbi:hypothetical protein KP79_PYT07306 [Mizuhopecten yessoensis]|uniref:Uncharacterized protein n=1 Tax=Mizuhopecten yessoensis TaxID=6573 RepID=A0A210QB04_MIZYE|nr:hypothetical protein KP79_PYT07306 [Mizuhopecten yessoensis]